MYEALWYDDKKMKRDFHTKEFTTIKAMTNFFEKHKNDADKFNWFLTKRNKDWEIIDVYKY